MAPAFPKILQVGRHRAKAHREVPAVSAKRRAKNAVRRELRDVWLSLYPRCEVRVGNPPCAGELTLHEPWTKARGGPVDDPRNWVTACLRHNLWLSRTVRGLAWGSVHGFLFHAREGRAWMEAGGRFPGLTREQAIEEIERRAAA